MSETGATDIRPQNNNFGGVRKEVQNLKLRHKTAE
jgi:hypothetical protein